MGSTRLLVVLITYSELKQKEINSNVASQLAFLFIIVKEFFLSSPHGSISGSPLI